MKRIKYPTKKEIFANPLPMVSEKAKQALLAWRKKYYWYWGIDNEEGKMTALVVLIYTLSHAYGKWPPKVLLSELVPASFVTEGNEVFLNSQSVITALHETAHFLFGKDELEATRWSLAWYKIIKPTFTGLRWKGHMLVPRRHSKQKRARSR